MALIQCDFKSKTIGMNMSMNVILPENSSQEKFPSLLLLHGHSDDHTTWQRRTSIERYVENTGLAVVMPAVHKSYYTNMQHGDRFWDYISEELPSIARKLFPLSSKREDNFVAGLSMGGYGAFKLGLNFPERFAAAASLSGAVCLNWREDEKVSLKHEAIFGSYEQFLESNNDLKFLAKKLSDSQTILPKIYQCCGTEDFLYQQNIEFKDLMNSLNFEYTYEEEPGEHNWGYWDTKIQNILNWLPLPKGSK